MYNWIRDRLFTTCSKSNKITGIKFENNWFSWVILPAIGLLATFWVVFRVATKPSRLSYPCVKAALPISTSFLVVLSGILTSMISVKKIKSMISNNSVNYPLLSFFVITFFLGIYLYVSGSHQPGYTAYSTVRVNANEPMGTAQGINPGRVVWAFDPDATNEDCTNSYNNDGVGNEEDDGWYLSKNNDQAAVDRMLSSALQTLTNTESDADAWDALFKFNNNERGKGEVGYQPGEKVMIKINATSGWGFGEFWGNITSDYGKPENSYYALSETSPHVVLALLHQLVNVIGVAQEDIAIGDPMKHVYNHCSNLWWSEFPNIVILDYDHTTHGRTQVVPSTDDTLFFSDRGSVLNVNKEFHYQVFHDCEYLFNIPTLKGHKRAGCTMFAKNHFGSHTRGNAEHLHPGLVDPDETSGTGDERTGYGKYRVQVDILGYELLHDKSVIYLMDALWATGWELDNPAKWTMAPFNNDWTSSIFVSQDPIAIESVGYDFLRSEFTAELHPTCTYVQMEGTDDYLHQAASSDNWPEGIVYDPEKDGTPLQSLGVHEHWNNSVAMQYSRNLGTGEGIELIKIQTTTDVEQESPTVANTYQLGAYPNPFNPSVNVQYTLKKSAPVKINIYNVRGQKVLELDEQFKHAGTHTDKISFSQYNMATGLYFIHLTTPDISLIHKVSYLR